MSKQPLYPHVPGGRKPEKIGTIWTAWATLYDKDRLRIAYCIDTPNGIAKAFMEMPAALYVTEMYSKDLQPRAKYEFRMDKWNVAQSNLQLLKPQTSTAKPEYTIGAEHEYTVTPFGYVNSVKYKAYPVQYKDLEFQIMLRNGWIAKVSRTGMPTYVFDKSVRKGGVTVKMIGYNTKEEVIEMVIEKYNQIPKGE